MSVNNNNGNMPVRFFYFGNDDLSKEIDNKLTVGFIQADRIMLFLICAYWLMLSTLGGASNGYYALGYLGGGLTLLIAILGYIYFKGTYINRILIGCVSCIIEVLYIQQELGSPTSHLIYFTSLGFLLLYRDGFAAVASLSLVMIHHLTATYCESIGLEILGMPILAFNWGRWDAYATHLYWAIFMAVLLCLVTYNSMLEFIRSERSINELEQLNKNLDSLVEKHNALLSRTLSEIGIIFSNISETVLAICQDKTIDTKYSDSSKQILNTEVIAGQNAISLLFNNSNVGENEQQQLSLALEQCFGKTTADFERQRALMVNECTQKRGDSYINLELVWQPILDSNDCVEKILVSIRDRTQLTKLQKQSDKKDRELSMILELISINVNEFFDFVVIATPILNKIKTLSAAVNANDKTSNIMSSVQSQLKTLKRDPICVTLQGFSAEIQDTLDYSELWQDDDKFKIEQLNGKLERLLKLLSGYEIISNDYLSWQRPQIKTSNMLAISKKPIDLILSAIDNMDELTSAQRSLLLNDLIANLREVDGNIM